MREGAAAPLPSFRRRGRVPRRGAIFPSVSAQKTDVAPCSIRPRNSLSPFQPGEFERAAALSTFLRIPATCAPRRPPFRGCAKGPQPLRLPSAGGGVYPAEERFFHPSAHKKRMYPRAPSVPETAYLLFSRKPPGEFERAAALSTFLHIPATCAPRRFPLPRGCAKGPQPLQLSFVSRRPAHPAFPPSRGCAKGPQPLRLPSAGGGVYPAEERFFHPSAHKKTDEA